MLKRLNEINQRKIELRKMLESDKEINFDEINKELEELDKEAKKIEERQKILNKISIGEINPVEIEKPAPQERSFEKMEKREIYKTPEYRTAFLKTLQGKTLTEMEKRAYDSTGAAGVIPETTANFLFDKMVQIAPMLGEIMLMRIAGNVKIGVEGTTADAAKHTENALVTPDADTITYVSLAGYEYMKVIRISKTVQTMAVDAFETFIVNTLADKLAEVIENSIINGDGVGDPKGIEYAATWDLTNSITFTDADDLFDACGLLPARYHSNAKWLVNTKTFYTKIIKVKDADGEPIIVKDMSGPVPFRILGFPVLLSDKVAADTMYLGDYKKVVGNLSQDVTVEASTQSGFLNNSIDYRGTCIFDCDIALPDAFVKINA